MAESFPILDGLVSDGMAHSIVNQQIITEQQISDRAYKLFEQRGRQHGHDKEDWDEAKAQLEREAVQQVSHHPRSNPSSALVPTLPKTRPAVFVGSSKEGVDIAKAIQVLLEDTCIVRIWKNGVFRPSHYTLDSLLLELDHCDFAILVFSPDDRVESRGQVSPSARDNVTLELGMFMGRLGPARTFLVFDHSVDLKIPSDLSGITFLPYEPLDDDNLEAILGASCTKIEKEIKRLGHRHMLRTKNT